MLELRTFRDDPERIRTAIRAKQLHDAEASLDELLAADAARRALRVDLEARQAERNSRSREIGERKRRGEPVDDVMGDLSVLAAEVKRLEERDRELAARIDRLLLEIPNPPHESVPYGESERDNVVVAEFGQRRSAAWLRPHWELAEARGWIDFGAGTSVTGAGFPVFRGGGARLVRALASFFLDRLGEEGFVEVAPPLLVNAASATATGQLPDKEGQMYEVSDGFYLIPTSEVPVTNLHRGQILDELDLPLRYCAFTPCFRREAGSYGKDVRGLNRLHQFDKVEMVVFTDPDESYAMLEAMTAIAERMLDDLGLAYRRLLMCTGDMGFTQAKKYDLEVWSPGQERWLEVSSVSNMEAFQAARLEARVRPGGAQGQGRTRLVHTLNGSALGFPRTIAAFLETHQAPEGDVALPPVLQPYLRQERLV
ncbi:MAG: serine--tRNA ligase [bacterium]|nr:serine--tRNA ligase [bacterium]